MFLDEVPGDSTDGFEDSGMAWVATQQAGLSDDVPARAFVGVDLEDAARRLAHVLRDRGAAVVATYEPGGGYGHPDHVRTHEVTRRARRPRRAASGPARGRARARTHSAVPTRRSRSGSAGDELRVPDDDGPLPSVAVADDQRDVEVDVLPVRDRVLDALRAHATQVQAVEAIDGDPALVGCYALSNRLLAPLLPVESYRLEESGVSGAEPPLAASVVWPPGVRPIP